MLQPSGSQPLHLGGTPVIIFFIFQGTPLYSIITVYSIFYSFLQNPWGWSAEPQGSVEPRLRSTALMCSHTIQPTSPLGRVFMRYKQQTPTLRVPYVLPLISHDYFAQRMGTWFVLIGES